MLLPVIMAGGSGSRLWPLSRQLNPKQFLPLVGETSLLQQTLARLEGLGAEKPLILCNEEHRFLVAEQLRLARVNGARVVLEPEGRNTAPAIALAALYARQSGTDPLLLVLAADHYIEAPERFRASVEEALPLAESGSLVTFGIVPQGPETGYGYLQRGEPLPAGGHRVARFIEKPERVQAEHYLEEGGFFWNSGMFVFQASRYLEELGRFEPEMLAACEAAMATAQADLDFVRVNAEAFAACPEGSIDFSVMEKTDAAAMVALDAGWNDIGSWSALWAVRDKDPAGNVAEGDVLLESARNNLVYADSRLVTVVGADNLVVVETKDAVLVAHRDAVQEVKAIVSRLKAADRCEHLNHREVYRPWGVYDSVDAGIRYQVKRITVKPGAKLSVQMHHHRAEHWVVVSGTARVTNGDKTYLVTENESTFIPVGQVHSLENPGRIPLELIEVQSGSYLGEDDIVRLQDRYGRQ